MNDIAVIHSTNGGIILVDSEKFQELNTFRWYIDPSGYPSRNRSIDGISKPVRMHKILCEAKEVDHRNRIRWVNCSWNLRPATDSQNNANRDKKSGFTSKYKGVSWYKAGKVWEGKIQVNRKTVYLGRYHSERDAAIAYNGAAMLHFGEFAVLNKV